MNRKLNNGIFYVVISLVAVLAVGSLVAAYNGVLTGNNFEGDCVNCTFEAPENVDTPDDVNLGAVPGGDIHDNVNIHGHLTIGSGAYNATSTSGVTVTLLEKDINNYYVIDMLNNKEGLTLTFPATSTMFQLLREEGATRSWLFHNATTTIAKTITLAPGTGVDFVSATSTLIIDANQWATVDCTRINYRAAANVDVMCNVNRTSNL